MRIVVLHTDMGGEFNARLGVAEAMQRKLPGSEIVTANIAEDIGMSTEEISDAIKKQNKKLITDRMESLIELYAPDVIISGGVATEWYTTKFSLMVKDKIPSCFWLQLGEPEAITQVASYKGYTDDLAMKKCNLIARYAAFYDGSRADNQMYVIGICGRQTPEKQQAAAAEWFNERNGFNSFAGRKIISVILGGDMGDYKFYTKELALKTADRVNKLCSESEDPMALLVTNSGRTPNEFYHEFVRHVKNPVSYFCSSNLTKNNPYSAWLGRGEALLVADDSMSMISDAMGTGQPVVLLAMGGNYAPHHKKLIADALGRGAVYLDNYNGTTLAPPTLRWDPSNFVADRAVELINSKANFLQ